LRALRADVDGPLVCEHLLMFAVLEKAIRDIMNFRLDRYTEVRIARASYLWMFELGGHASREAREYVFSAQMICYHLGLKISDVRAAITAALRDDNERHAAIHSPHDIRGRSGRHAAAARAESARDVQPHAGARGDADAGGPGA